MKLVLETLAALSLMAGSFAPLALAAGTNDLATFDEAVRRDPKSPLAFDRRGWAHGANGEWDKAIADFDQAIGLNPNDSVAYGLRGQAYSEKGQTNQALSDLNKALVLNPKDALAYHNRATIRLNGGDLDGGMQDINHAIRLDPTRCLSYVSRGHAYVETGSFTKALADFNEAVRLDPNEAKAHNALACLLATCPDDSLRNGQNAVEAAKRACELDKWKTWYFVQNLAAAYAEAGDCEKAVAYQKKATSLPGLTEKDRTQAEVRLQLFLQRKPYHESRKS
jgi:tetratricopeptide (TPR) repeat protein